MQQTDPPCRKTFDSEIEWIFQAWLNYDPTLPLLVYAENDEGLSQEGKYLTD